MIHKFTPLITLFSFSLSFGMQQSQLPVVQLQQGVYNQLSNHEEQLLQLKRYNAAEQESRLKLALEKEAARKIKEENRKKKDEALAKARAEEVTKLEKLEKENAELRKNFDSLKTAAIWGGILGGVSAIVGFVWLVLHETTAIKHEKTLYGDDDYLHTRRTYDGGLVHDVKTHQRYLDQLNNGQKK